MTTVVRTITMIGPAVRDRGASPAAAGGVLSVIDRSLHGAVDMAFRGASGRGRRQSWLHAAGCAEFFNVEKSGTDALTLSFQVHRFGDVAAPYFEQQQLFEHGPKPTDTAFDVLADVVADVVDQRRDSDRFDAGLLKRLERFETSVFQHGIDRLEVGGTGAGDSDRWAFDARLPVSAKRLSQQTPSPQRARVAGRLDLIQASTMAFQLLLQSGERVRGVWKRDEFETLRELANQDVVATGMATFRPSGTLLRLDAESLVLQRREDALFNAVPTPAAGRLDVGSLLREQRRRGGAGSVWQSLPPEESDEAFLAAVAELD